MRVGARYQAEVDVPGHRLHGVLVCRELQAPRRAVYALERGLDLTIVVLAQPVDPGCRLELRVSYTVGGLAGWAVERSTIGPVRRGSSRRLRPWPPGCRVGHLVRPAAQWSRTGSVPNRDRCRSERPGAGRPAAAPPPV